jgi:nicotinamidase-related amidase
MSFNSSNAALLVVDLQRGLFRRPSAVHNEGGLIKNIVRLISEAHEANVQVIHAHHFNKALHGSGLASIKMHPSIELAENDIVLYKEQTSAFKNTTLCEELKKRNLDKVIVTGLVTQGCIKSTCLEGKALGYDVILVADGHSNYNQNAEEIINQWNENLKKENITVLKTEDIHFI